MKSMLRIFTPNERSARDILSGELLESLSRQGVSSSLTDLWPQGIYRAMNSGKMPFGRRVFRRLMADSLATKCLGACRAGDLAWILSFCAPCTDKARAELKLKQRGVRYIFHVMDDWFSFEWLREGTVRRCKLADLVIVPTPQLKKRVRQFVPRAEVEVLEEPVSISRLRPGKPGSLSEAPVVVWNGNPFNLENIDFVVAVLRTVHARTPFKLRIICETPPASGMLDGLDVEWKAFHHDTESELMAGSWFGIAPMPDTEHNRCKGAYKIKTYCASGLPVIASPVGFQEALVREGNGIGFLPASAAEWEDSLGTMLRNPGLRLDSGRKARAYAERRFSYEAVAPQWVDCLKAHFGEISTGAN